MRLHSGVSGEVLAIPGEHADVVHAVAWSAKAGLWATGSDDGEHRLWKPGAVAQIVRTWTVQRVRAVDRQVWALAFAADGKHLLSGMGDGVIRLFDVTTGEESGRFLGHRGRVLALALSPDGARLASAGQDGKVRLWNVSTRALESALGGHAKQVYGLAWHPSGRWLASGSFDGSVRIWEAAAGVPRQRIDASTEGVYGVAFSADGRRLAVACADGRARLYGPPEASPGETAAAPR